MKQKIKEYWKCNGIYYIKKMETYCVICKKYIANENYVRKTK